MSLQSGSRHCHFKTKSGKRCKAWSMSGSRFCFFHDPKRKTQRSEAQKRGGQYKSRRSLPPSTPDAIIDSAADIVRLLGTTISQTRRGEIDTRIATCIGYLCSTILRAREQGELEERLAKLEQQLEFKSEESRCHSLPDYIQQRGASMI
jgi:hypothetical protein